MKERKDSIIQSNLAFRGYTKVSKAVIREKSLSRQARLLYVLLTDYWQSNDSCFPSQKTLARDLGYEDRKSVRRLLKELEEFGVLRIERGEQHSRENIGPDPYDEPLPPNRSNTMYALPLENCKFSKEIRLPRKYSHEH